MSTKPIGLATITVYPLLFLALFLLGGCEAFRTHSLIAGVALALVATCPGVSLLGFFALLTGSPTFLRLPHRRRWGVVYLLASFFGFIVFGLVYAAAS